jgi:hypothetical protein
LEQYYDERREGERERDQTRDDLDSHFAYLVQRGRAIREHERENNNVSGSGKSDENGGKCKR